MSDSRPDTMRIVDNADANRYEAYVDGKLAGFADYIRTKNLIAFVHTEVEEAYEGQGIGGALVRTSLDAARAAEAPVLAVCPFYTGWIARHPEYGELLYTNRSRVRD
jgi:predicted GNAT family acetyltransferase